MESIKETYVTFEQARALKRLGFDWKCEEYIRQAGGSPGTGIRWVSFPRPRIDFAAKWLREVKKIHIYVHICPFTSNSGEVAMYIPHIEDIEEDGDEVSLPFHLDKYKTYEEAMSEGITAALKYLEELQ